MPIFFFLATLCRVFNLLSLLSIPYIIYLDPILTLTSNMTVKSESIYLVTFRGDSMFELANKDNKQ